MGHMSGFRQRIVRDEDIVAMSLYQTLALIRILWYESVEVQIK